MTESTDFLDAIDIASPCSAEWDDMTGDDRVRSCADCKLNVYNLSEMSRGEATRTVEAAEGRLCVRFYRRADGTMITRDCPVGLAALRRRARLAGARLVALLGILWTGLLSGCEFRDSTRVPGIEQGEPTVPGCELQEMGEMSFGNIYFHKRRSVAFGKYRIAQPRVIPAPARSHSSGVNCQSLIS